MTAIRVTPVPVYASTKFDGGGVVTELFLSFKPETTKGGRVNRTTSLAMTAAAASASPVFFKAKAAGWWWLILFPDRSWHRLTQRATLCTSVW